MLSNKEKLEEELLESENEIVLSGKLQDKKEMADMFDKMVDPEYQEQKIIEENRRKFIKKNIAKVGL